MCSVIIIISYRAGVIVISKACSVLLLCVATKFTESCLQAFVSYTIPIIIMIIYIIQRILNLLVSTKVFNAILLELWPYLLWV